MLPSSAARETFGQAEDFISHLRTQADTARNMDDGEDDHLRY